MQALQELDVGGGDDLRVAAVTDDADRAVDELELGEHLDEEPPRDRVTAPETEVVLGALQQVGRERRDLARAREVDVGHASMIGSFHRVEDARADDRRRRSRSPWRMPDSSWLTPPIACTGTAPFDREAHVVDHLTRVELVHEHQLAA